MGALAGIRRRLGVVGEIFYFLWRERLWWMLPLVLALLGVSALVLFSSSPAVAPFIYALF